MANKKIPFYKPPITDREAKAAYDVIKSGWMTFGNKTEEFEKKFAEYIGAPYCVMVNSCTQALNLSLAYWKKYKDNDETSTLSVTSLTCAATAFAAIWNGFDVKFEDLEPDLSFSMKQVENPSIPVHYAGKYNKQPFPAVEDSAHRILPNSFTGVTTCFSFYATKNITTGEGGMIACVNKDEYDWYRKARLYAIDKAAYKRQGMFDVGEKFWEFQSEFIGYKCNPTDIVASIGLVQLDRIDELNKERQRVAKSYNDKLGLDYDRECWHLYPILVNDRDVFMHYMKNYNIHCSVHFIPLHKQKAFEPWFNKKFQKLPVTDWVYDRLVSLPFYPYMEELDIESVCKAVKSWEKKHDQANIKSYKEN
jgi:dTDP-4-amino-4,6-dideoxygalactose transaminase